MKTYYLWMFSWSTSHGLKIVITRGETQQQAYVYATRGLERGKTITCHDQNLIDSAEKYALNHAEGWLHRSPDWLAEKAFDANRKLLAMDDAQLKATWAGLMNYQPEEGWSKDLYDGGMTMETWSMMVYSEMDARGFSTNTAA